MNKHSFIFKKDNYQNWKAIAVECYRAIQTCLAGTKSMEFQIEIKPYSKRSQNALAAYWVLINAVVRWSNEQGNSYTDKDFDEWFKREAGLVEEVDMMPMWKMKYKIQNDTRITEDSFHDGMYLYCDFEFNYISLGERYIQRTRSISNKGDVTKPEMEKLLSTVLQFGAINDIKECVITNTELDKLLKFYEN